MISSQIINIEDIRPIDVYSSSNIENRGSILASFDGVVCTEHINGASGDTIFSFENKGSPAISSSLNYENKLLFGVDATNDLRFEQGAAASGLGEILQNNKFYLAYTGDLDASSIPPWQFIFNTGHIVQMPTRVYGGRMEMVNFEDLFHYADTEPTGNSFKNKNIFIGRYDSDEDIFKLRETIKLRQKIRTEVGVTYNFQYSNNLFFDPTYRIGDKAPRFTMKAGSGSIYHQTIFDDNHLGQISGQFTSSETSVIMEFEVPQHLDDTVTWKPEWSLTEQDYYDTIESWRIVWGVTNPSLTKA